MNKWIMTVSLVALLSPTLLAAEKDIHAGRGNPWEYDQGPEKGSEFLQILSETPNFRGIQDAIFDNKKERFRWHWGPVRYRGRTRPGEVKVMVVGQEGAQDEAASNRTFTGGTGQKMQNFLHYLGIDQSYIFLNTYQYCIFSQYRDPAVSGAEKGDFWMAADPNSPIAGHRHRLFNNVLENNDLRLVIAVGRAARDSVVSWVKSRGGDCLNETNLNTCDTSVLGEKVKLLHVPHPGGAGQAETDEDRDKVLEGLRRAFEQRAGQVAEWVYEDPEWLPVDSEIDRGDVVIKHYDEVVKPESEGWDVRAELSDGVVLYQRNRVVVPADGEPQTVRVEFPSFAPKFSYKSRSIPYRDFAFGMMWTLGSGGTSSNRGDNQRSVGVFSREGEYGSPGVRYSKLPTKTQKQWNSGYVPAEGDLAYEPPKANPNAFDPGPGEAWARLLMGGEEGLAWPDFSALGAISHSSFGTGPIYRGRFNEARFLIVADQSSQDDLFTGRALTGDAGQKLQHFLRNAGITRSYVIIRTLPVDTLGLDAKDVDRISRDPQVVKVRNEILNRIVAQPVSPNYKDQSLVQVILTVGPHAAKAVVLADLDEKTPVINLKAAFEDGAPDNWTKGLQKLSRLKYDKDRGVKPNFKARYENKKWQDTRLEINREDLPVEMRRWVGTSGDLGSRSKNDVGHYYKLSMPWWAFRLDVSPLNEEEIDGLVKGGWLDSSKEEVKAGSDEEEEERAETPQEESEWK